ncbi:MAG TPA: nitrate/sulfonate/bicarbonate ABC transporter ATP-binding protein [Xanthobacteraceae bacterium]|nr:nitrate/sulfonate/bicarbonate ABC transporter ATP-binding protein [Xanthobacteraceae bacterium]
MPDPAKGVILDLRQICMVFKRPSGESLSVLENIDMSLRNGEILGLLGRSGSGKSTLLRIAGGLIKPTSGFVSYRDKPLTGPAEGIAVVFQTFALFPWLTVLENVEAGLDALGLPRAESRRRAEAAIDLIGLDGFQSAYPRELSGGMRQRVGFARAIVTQPEVLLMDEPFSALDVLTAETLRTDFLDLWIERQLPTKSVLLVTHNVEEAVLMCDRVLLLSSNPGRIAAEIPIPLQHPRNRLEDEFHCVVEEIYSVLTARTIASIGALKQVHGGLGQPLPQASVNRISGLVEKLIAAPYGGQADLGTLATSLVLEVDDLFPIAEALHMLEFAELKNGALKLTAPGRIFATSDTEQRKLLFKEHLLRFVPLIAHICRVLSERTDHRAPRARFEIELEDHLTRRDANKTLNVATAWGRYAELFAYDDKMGFFHSRHTTAR